MAIAFDISAAGRAGGRGLCALLICWLATGCISGPHWKSDPELGARPGLGAGKRFVVSGFMSSQRAVSVTSSPGITTILESAHVQDISARVADGLAVHGITAEARVGATPSQLADDELLIRGAVLSPDRYTANEGPAFAVTFFSLGLLGMFAPCPVAFEEGRYVRYRVDVIDPAGRILLSTGDRTMIGYFEVRHSLWRPTPIQLGALHEAGAWRTIEAIGATLAAAK